MLAVLKVMICYTSAVQQHNTIEHKWLNPVFGSFVNVEDFFYVPLPMSILNPSTLFLNLARPFLSLRLVDFSLLKMFVKFRKSLKKRNDNHIYKQKIMLLLTKNHFPLSNNVHFTETTKVCYKIKANRKWRQNFPIKIN